MKHFILKYRIIEMPKWSNLSKISLIAIIAMLVTSVPKAFAVDFGKIGKTFEIQEEGFVAMMKRKLAKVDMEKERKKMEKIARDRIENPTPVSGITKAKADRTFYFDPTYTLDKDMVLPCGRIIQKAGAKANPLEREDLNRRIFFIDARDEMQMQWLEEQLEHPLFAQEIKMEDLVILVGGSVFKVQDNLTSEHKDKVYFDQYGELTNKLVIKHTPAIAKQEGFKIRIDEINLKN
jgi:conjugal transfer pilus assembly protein TraW